MARSNATNSDRSAGHAAPNLSCGSLRLDPRAARASVGGEPLRLTSLEYRLLHYLIMHQDRVISRTELHADLRVYPIS